MRPRFYKIDFRCFGRGIFFETGLDRRTSDLPVRQNLLSLQFVGWVERKANPIMVQYNGDGFRKGAQPTSYPANFLRNAGASQPRAKRLIFRRMTSKFSISREQPGQ